MERDLLGKKLLILAGSEVHCKAVEAAKELGVYTIVTDYLAESPAKALADESWMLSIVDTDAIIRKCREESVDGVLNICNDTAQFPYVTICEALGLPCYGTYDQLEVLTNKNELKKICRKLGLGTIKDYKLEDINSVCVNYPVLVKPADSRGSRGQTICYCAEDLQDGVQFAMTESPTDSIVIEQYMGDKQDFEMTYIVIDYVPYLLKTADRYLGSKKSGLSRQCSILKAPSKHTNTYVECVDHRMKKLAAQLGIQNGPFFMQGFVDGNTVRFYDAGLRFPGAEYERIYNEANSIDLMKMMVVFALTGKMSTPKGIESGYLLGEKHSAQIFASARAGVIAQINGLDTIRNHPNVVCATLKCEIGDEIKETGDVKQRVAEIAILADSPVSLSDIASETFGMLEVLDVKGKNMLLPLDPQYLYMIAEKYREGGTND